MSNITENELNNQNLSIVEQSQEIVILTREDNEEANELLKKIMAGKKTVNAYWKDPIDKAHQTHKELTTKRNEMLKPITTAEGRVKGKISEYITNKEKERKEAEAKIQQEAKEQGIDVKPIVEKEEKPKGQAYRNDWYVEAIDLNLLPKEYWIPDTKRLDAIARAEKEKAKIPGVKFNSKVIIISRSV